MVSTVFDLIQKELVPADRKSLYRDPPFCICIFRIALNALEQ